MTRKQLEELLNFNFFFNEGKCDIEWINQRYGLSLTEATSPSQAVTAYLEAKGIRLKGDRTAIDSELLPEFKGTTGKWRLVETDSHPGHKNEQIAFIQTETHCMDLIAFEDSVIDRATFHANAQLISKAPEMLSTLQGLLTEANKLTDESGLTETFCQRFNQIEKLIKSATEVTNG